MEPTNDFLDNLANRQNQKMLREIANDTQTPKSMIFQFKKTYMQEFVMMMIMMIGSMELSPFPYQNFN